MSIFLSFGVLASEWAEKIQISGFSSAIYRQSNVVEYFNGASDAAGINEDGSYQGTRFGLNINARITDKLTIASQFLASREENNFTTRLDWGFLSFMINDEFKFRAGKIKFPVGIVNEYVDVGYTYPWITPPVLFYSEQSAGPQATREAYVGSSVYWSLLDDDWSYSVDLYNGEVVLSSMTVRKLTGFTARVEWNDVVAMQLSTYSGTMRNESMAMMDGRKHAANALGFSADWNNIVAYVESSNVKMGDFLTGKGKAWYATLGYRFGKLMPHFTVQEFDKAKETTAPQHQKIQTLGLRYELMMNTSLKFEYSTIITDSGIGLFSAAPGKDVNSFGMALDIVF